jgi:endonuclease/exonuclease/phosphatase family metal-dependent hydrolase
MPAVMEGAHFRLMTYNIGGARKDFEAVLDDVIRVIQENSPDILVLQEAVEWLDAEQCWHGTASTLAKTLGYIEGVHFGPTLTMQEHFYPGKAIFVHAISRGWQEWRYGNAILSRWGFVRQGYSSEAGEPRNISLFHPLQYDGNRDTEPRYALLARIQADTASPFIIGTHLSTLVGEQGEPEQEIAGKSEKAQEMRFHQVRRLLDLIRAHMLETGELVFLMGDLNATVNETCIADVLVGEAGFVRLIPENDHTPTHQFKVKGPVDHIFVYPASRLVDYHCKIVDTPLARHASDHLPVVAEVSVT